MPAAAKSACAAIGDDATRLACYDDVNLRKHDGKIAYRSIDLLDLKAEGKALAGAPIEVKGYGWLVENILTVGADPQGRISIKVDVSAVARDTKRRLITDCGEPFDRSRCAVAIKGHVITNPYADAGDTIADTVVFQ